MFNIDKKIFNVCISQNMGRFTNLPTPKDLMSLKEDLEFKEGEMKKSEMTTIELAARKWLLKVQTKLTVRINV
jgi:hypothetical protein